MIIHNEILNKVKRHALDHLQSRRDFGHDEVNLFLHTHGVEKGQSMVLGLDGIAISSDSILVLLDLEPLYNWGHACEFMLYDAENGDYYETHVSQLPPASFHHTPEQYEAIHAPVAYPYLPKSEMPEPARIPELERAMAHVAGERYAILFSGMSDNRHLNDLEFLYRTLLDVYKFDANNIIVLNYNGRVNYGGSPQPVTLWPGDNTPYRIKVNAPGTEADLGRAFDEMKGKLQSEDLLLIHTNNHGGGQPADPEAWLCCYPNWSSFSATDFGNKLKTLPAIASLMVMMEQCHSGGFQDAVLNNSRASVTSFAAACIATANSMGGKDFDPFAKDWIAGMKGSNPDGSALAKPVAKPTSAYDAFAYAYSVKHQGDSPVYADKPGNSGKTQYLS